MTRARRKDWGLRTRAARSLQYLAANAQPLLAAAGSALASNLSLTPSSSGPPSRKRKRSMRASTSVLPSNTVAPSGRVYEAKRGKKKKSKITVRSLKKEVESLKKDKKKNLAKHCFYQTATGQAVCASSQAGYTEVFMWNPTAIESMLDSLPILNTAAPGTKTAVDMTTITNPTNWDIDCWAEVVIKNNYLYPVDVTCYIIKPKEDMSTSPSNACVLGYALKANPSITSQYDINFYPSDSSQFGDTWTIIKSCSPKRLTAGDELVEKYSSRLHYDQEDLDLVSATYKRKHTVAVLVRVQGTVAHDSVTVSNIGTSEGAVDIIVRRKFKVAYPAIAPQETLDNSNGLVALDQAVVGVASAETENSL